MEIKAGDKIRYTSAAGTQLARVNSISIGPTAKPNFSNVWLSLTIFGVNGKKDQNVTIPADDSSLKMFKVELAD